MSLTFPWAQPNYYWHIHHWVGSLVPELQNATWPMNEAGASVRELTSARSSSQPMTGKWVYQSPAPSPSRWGNSKEGTLGFQSFLRKQAPLVLSLTTHFLYWPPALVCTTSPSPSRVLPTLHTQISK